MQREFRAVRLDRVLEQDIEQLLVPIELGIRIERRRLEMGARLRVGAKRFVAGEIQVLVATAVVEVGVDVPNATVMMIEGADRFGLAQLHQFRGRVGRGAGQSHCWLLTDDPSEPALNRLNLMTRIRDGFRLAEEDMRIRGMGELMGPRQHGMTDIAMQALQQPELLSEVRQEAESLLESDPGFDQNPLLKKAVARRLELTSIS